MLTLPILIVSTVLGGAPAAGADLENAVLDFSATWCGPCQQVSPLVAKLERAGLPIHKIDVDKNQALATKYGVSSIPAFLVVINGKVVDRQVGVQSEQTLRDMCRKVTQARAPQASRAPPAKAVGRAQSASETPAAQAVMGQPFPATVRIRVKDPSGDDVGTGTIIHNADGRSLVLTCGHLFKNWDEKQSRIQVEVFEKGTGRVILGRKLAADLEADVALISIPSDQPLPSCTLAARGSRPTKGTPLVSVGCNGGAPPTLERHKVVALNRYTGPDNLECTGIPVRGRSGGGLFTPGGEVVGVCMAEDPNYKDGMYAGLEPIYRLLDRLHLTSLFQAGGQPQMLAAEEPEDGPTAPPEARPRTALLDDNPQNSLGDEVAVDDDPVDSTELAESLGDGSTRPTLDSGSPTMATRMPPQKLVQRALQQSKAGDIVCVIPGRSGRPEDTTVLVIHEPGDDLRRTLEAGPTQAGAVPVKLAGLPPAEIRRQMKEADRLPQSRENLETELPENAEWEEDAPSQRSLSPRNDEDERRIGGRSVEEGFQPVPRSRTRSRGAVGGDTDRRSASASRGTNPPRESLDSQLGESEEASTARGAGGTFRRGRPMSLRPVLNAD
jgi:thioredoxin